MLDGESKIPEPDLELVTCNQIKCSSRGEYTNCYLGLEKRCELYPKLNKNELKKYIDEI